MGQNPKTCEYLSKCMPKPVVFIDSEEGDYDNVSGQSVDGARSMAEYLLSQGHEKIAFFCDERMDYGSTKEKLQGVREALEAVGKNLRRKIFLWCRRSGFCVQKFSEALFQEQKNRNIR